MKKSHLVGTLFMILLGFASWGVTDEQVTEEVYIIARERELLGFSAIRNRWVIQSLRSGEKIIELKYGGHVGVAVSQLRVFGFSALTTTWAEEKLMVGESVVKMDARGNVGAVITNLRALGFGAKNGRWTVEPFRLK